MNKDRRFELDSGESDSLTKLELEQGWRWCDDCDGLLINMNEKPLHFCFMTEEEKEVYLNDIDDLKIQ